MCHRAAEDLAPFTSSNKSLAKGSTLKRIGYAFVRSFEMVKVHWDTGYGERTPTIITSAARSMEALKPIL